MVKTDQSRRTFLNITAIALANQSGQIRSVMSIAEEPQVDPAEEDKTYHFSNKTQ